MVSLACASLFFIKLAKKIWEDLFCTLIKIVFTQKLLQYKVVVDGGEFVVVVVVVTVVVVAVVVAVVVVGRGGIGQSTTSCGV